MLQNISASVALCMYIVLCVAAQSYLPMGRRCVHPGFPEVVLGEEVVEVRSVHCGLVFLAATGVSTDRMPSSAYPSRLDEEIIAWKIDFADEVGYRRFGRPVEPEILQGLDLGAHDELERLRMEGFGGRLEGGLLGGSLNGGGPHRGHGALAGRGRVGRDVSLH